MTVALVIAAALAAAPAPATLALLLPTGEIERAIAMRRFDQARLMIGAAVRGGATGASIERPLAALAFAAGRDEEALARTTALLEANPEDAALLEQAAIAALRLYKADEASALARRATRAAGASWRAWNALGVAADRAGDWTVADAAYAKAEALAPGHFEIANNRGWSLLLRGEWQQARDLLARAAALSPGAERAANNLDLARIGLAGELPAQRSGERSADYAARLNDAGVAARMRGETQRARAAFARAIEASSSWYARAGRNLAAIEGSE